MAEARRTQAHWRDACKMAVELIGRVNKHGLDLSVELAEMFADLLARIPPAEEPRRVGLEEADRAGVREPVSWPDDRDAQVEQAVSVDDASISAGRPASDAEVRLVAERVAAKHRRSLARLDRADGTCPTCGSLDQRRHPALQFEGEVQLCRDPFHVPSAAEIEARAAAKGKAAQLLQIAGLVNTYHNDGTGLNAAATLRAIADVLGLPMGDTAPPVDAGTQTAYCAAHELWWSGPYVRCPVCHLSALVAPQDDLPSMAARIAALEAELAKCYRLTGADPDGNDDRHLAPFAAQEVERLRSDADESATFLSKVNDELFALKTSREALIEELERSKRNSNVLEDGAEIYAAMGFNEGIDAAIEAIRQLKGGGQ